MAIDGCLKWAITNGDLEQVRKALDEGQLKPNSDLSGSQPLHLAADFGQDEVIKCLVSKGANVNAVDSHGRTALLAAIWEGHTSTVKLLLSLGAKKDLIAPDGTLYVDCAEKLEIRQLLSS